MKQEVFTVYSEPLSFGEIQEKGEKKFIAEGFISTSDRDLVDDIVTDRALDRMMEQMKTRVIKLDFEHEAFRGETDIEKEINKTRLTLAKAIDFTRVNDGDNNGLKVRWEFNDTWKKFDSKGDVTMDFSDIKKNIERGFYDAFSIAFVPTHSIAKEAKDGSQLRLLDDLNLLNVALTGNPINPGAAMTNVFLKSLDALKNVHSDPEEEEDDDQDPKKKKKNNIQKEVKKVVNNDEAKDEAQNKNPESQDAGSSDESGESSEDESSGSEGSEQKDSGLGVEVKSRLDAMEKDIAEIKAAVSKPINKSVSEQAPRNSKAEEKAVEPLDLI